MHDNHFTSYIPASAVVFSFTFNSHIPYTCVDLIRASLGLDQPLWVLIVDTSSTKHKYNHI